MCGCKIFSQDGTHQELLNHWRTRRLRYIKNNANSLTMGSVEQLNAENIFSIYSDVVLPGGKSIHPRAKYVAFTSMCDSPQKYINMPKWSFVLNCCSECPGVFVPDAEMNDGDYGDIPFILFYHCENISSCFLHKHLLTKHSKTCPLCTNI